MDGKIRNEDLIKVLGNSKFGWKVSLYVPAGKTNEEVKEYLVDEISNINKVKNDKEKEEIDYCLNFIISALFFRNEDVSMVYFVDYATPLFISTISTVNEFIYRADTTFYIEPLRDGEVKDFKTPLAEQALEDRVAKLERDVRMLMAQYPPKPSFPEVPYYPPYWTGDRYGRW